MAGRQAVVLDSGKLVSTRLKQIDDYEDQLLPVWRSGEHLIRHGFDQIRQRTEGKVHAGRG